MLNDEVIYFDMCKIIFTHLIFSYFNESGRRCAVVLIVTDNCKQK